MVRYSSVSLRISVLLISLPVFAVIFAAAPPVCILEIAYAEGGGRIFWTQIGPGERFSLEYTHSVQLSRVTDDFEIEQHRRILLVGTTFSDHGAGLPHHLYRGGIFSVQRDGKFKISGMRMSLPEILLRTGQEYGNTFVCETRRINLSQQYGDALFVIRTRDYSILKSLIWRVLNVG